MERTKAIRYSYSQGFKASRMPKLANKKQAKPLILRSDVQNVATSLLAFVAKYLWDAGSERLEASLLTYRRKGSETHAPEGLELPLSEL